MVFSPTEAGAMTGEQLRRARERKGWSQGRAAPRLGLSQPYLSLLETGRRRVPGNLARKATAVYGLSAAALPMGVASGGLVPPVAEKLASELAALGYPGLAYLKRRRRQKNPAEILLSALSAGDLESRLVEVLPSVVWKFPELDWGWLAGAAKLHDLQNRLGFVTGVARRLAEKFGERDKAALLGQREAELERSRLAREDTLCHDSLTRAERRWLRRYRPAEAKHWGLLTDLSPKHLRDVT
jgi:transcriptional regulator with XRE-family HTH domain